MCFEEVWTFPTISNEVQSLIHKVSLQLPSVGPLLLQVLPGPRPGERRDCDLLGCSDLVGFLAQRKAMYIPLFGTGLKTSHPLAFPNSAR